MQSQVDAALHNAIHGFDHDEAKLAASLEAEGSSREQFDAESREAAEKAIKTQLLMDAIADHLGIEVGQNDLSERLVLMSRQYGIEPQQLVQLLQQNNQLPAVFADVRRGLTVAAVVEAATVVDTAGNVVDTSEFFGTPGNPRLLTKRPTRPRSRPARPKRRPNRLLTRLPKTPTPSRQPRTNNADSERSVTRGVSRAPGWLGSSGRSVIDRYEVAVMSKQGFEKAGKCDSHAVRHGWV